MIDKIKKLKGLTLSTLAQNKKFTIEKVDESIVLVKLHETGGHRTIKMDEFENGYKKLVLHGLLSLKELNDDTLNSSYVITILSHFEGVIMRKNPIKLYVKG